MNLTHILAPLFLCVFAGIAYGKWRGANAAPGPFVAVVMDVLMPALVFDALISADLTIAEMAAAGAASVMIIALLLVLCVISARVTGWPLRSFALPVLFMNAGFMGIPLMSLAFGPAAVGRIVVFDQIQTFGMFSLGIWIAAPGESREHAIKNAMKAFFREPLVYAIIAGAGLRIAGARIPESILFPVRFLGSATPPVALFALGLRLAATPYAHIIDPRIHKRLATILILRFAAGFLCGYAAAEILGLEGVSRMVVLTASVLPSAVFSYVLAERYNAEPDIAASAVFASTILSIPILSAFLRLIG